MSDFRAQSELPSGNDLEQLFQQKYARSDKVGWAPLRRHDFGYYLPADVYEACVSKQVFDGCSWVDVGGGHDIFPDNPALARSLVSRCSLVVAVDPSENVKNNDFVHRRSQCFLEDYRADELFDLVTLRMVVEHVENPKRFVVALQGILRPGGIVVIFTVSKMSPNSWLARLIPFRLHHPIKQLFWGDDEEDTFPVHYKMNARSVLRSLFGKHGFEEVAFAYVDDLSTFARFPHLNYAELAVWKVLGRVGVKYPENCLLGVYKKSDR